METDDLIITVGGKQLSGWTEAKLTRGIEVMPSSFDLGLTEKFPATGQDILIAPGNTCTVAIGDTLVLTGYVDQYSVELSATAHNVRIRGRSKCADIVDCSAGIGKGGTWFGSQQGGSTAYALATLLSAPFGISVTNQTGMDGTVVPYFNVNFGETAYEVIERVSRYAGFLTYDDVNGNLVLAVPGQSKMASGFSQGDNVQSAQVMLGMNNRYSDYYAVLQAVDTQQDDTTNTYLQAHVLDQGVPRFRPLGIVSEQASMQSGLPLARQRAYWERNRRLGRSQVVRITCDSWRDTHGTLWQPNAYAPINIPLCKLNNLSGTSMDTDSWVISQVTYNRTLDSGTTADIVMMPAIAFSIEPTVLSGLPQDEIQHLTDGTAPL